MPRRANTKKRQVLSPARTAGQAGQANYKQEGILLELHLWRTLVSTLASILVLFLLAKLLGARQISQLSFFDYINGITIGSIAAEAAIGGFSPDALRAFAAMVVFGLFSVLAAATTNKSIKLRKLLEGKPMPLYDNDKLFEENLKAAKLDVNEFLMNCRCAGYFDLADIQTAFLETNGQISFLPKSTARPVTPEDFEMRPQQDKAVHNLVIDGRIMEDCLKNSGNDRVWLERQLAAQRVKAQDLILATCDGDNKLTVYPKTGRPEEKDIFL